MESTCYSSSIIFMLLFNKNMEFIDELRKKSHNHIPEENVCGSVNVCCKHRIRFVKRLNANDRNFSVMQNVDSFHNI